MGDAFNKVKNYNKFIILINVDTTLSGNVILRVNKEK